MKGQLVGQKKIKQDFFKNVEQLIGRICCQTVVRYFAAGFWVIYSGKKNPNLHDPIQLLTILYDKGVYLVSIVSLGLQWFTKAYCIQHKCNYRTLCGQNQRRDTHKCKQCFIDHKKCFNCVIKQTQQENYSCPHNLRLVYSLNGYEQMLQ